MARHRARPQIDVMHHEVHAQCFIASSVKTQVLCEPVYEGSTP